jgi:colicin import membrane protein
MDLAEAQAEIKAANGDASKISADALAAVAEYKAPEGLLTPDEANARVASARKKAEKLAAENAAKVAELQEQLEDAAAGKSGASDVERKLEKLEAKLKAAQAEAEQAKADAVSTKKSMAMAKINAEIGWAEGIGQEARDALVNAKFGTLDLDDLMDADAVKPLIGEFRESNPWAVNGSAAAGAGSKPGGAAASTGPKEVTQSALVELAKTDKGAYDANMKAVSAGELKIVA